MIDFSKYVSQYRRPQSYSLGPALRQLRQQDQAQQGIDNQASQYESTRSDTQATNAANYARDTATAANSKEKLRYDRQMAAIEEARRAGQSGRGGIARALIPQIRELGGQAVENPDGTFFFKEGAAPSLAAPDVAGARQQIYGGAPGPQRNPLDPPALPGASAAALPPKPAQSPAIGAPPAPPAGAPPDPGPPPGAAVDAPPGPARSVPPEGAVWLPPGVDPGPQPTSAEADLAALNAVGGEPDLESAPAPQAPEPTGPNPFQPPGLDDAYTIDPRRVQADNHEHLKNYMEGVRLAMPSRFAPRLEAINKYVSSLGLPPDETLKLVQPMYNEIFAMARSEVTAEGQAGRLEQMGAHQQSIRDDKLRQFAVARINKLTENDSLKDTKKKLTAGREAMDLIPDAHRNGNSANALIESIYRMKNTGVMTDKDFDRSAKGVQSLWGLIKKGALNSLLRTGGGFDPTTVNDLKELVETSIRSHGETMKIAANSLISGYRSAPNPIEREEFGRAIVQFLPEEYLPEEFVEPWMKRAQQGGQVPVVEDEQEAMRRMAAAEGGVVDNVGVVPVPDGRHPTAPTTRAAQPRKTPSAASKKDPKQMTNAELMEEMKRLEAEANAP